LKAFVSLREQFGKDFRFGDDGHEVGVAVLTGDDVDVQVLFNAAPAQRPKFSPMLKPCG